MHLKPSAPPMQEVLRDEEVDYNCELGCDVEFLVGEGRVMRIPVHSRKFMQFPVFRAMLTHNGFATEEGSGGKEGCGWERRMRQIPVKDVDGKAFDNLMRFIYGKPVDFQLQTVETVVETLKAAHKYLVTPVVRQCAKHLSKMISFGNVIWIYASVEYLCNDVDKLEELTKKEFHKPIPKCIQLSGSALKGLEKQLAEESLAGLEIKGLCVWLLSQVLAFIDVHAKDVLMLDEVEQLDSKSLHFLLKRDSLDVSESVVFFALLRWAETQCKRRQLPLTSESKRLVLHELLYLVRFFQMTEFEFRAGPESFGLLNREEREVIKNMIEDGKPHCCFNIGENIQNWTELHNLLTHWAYLSRPRAPAVKNGLKRKSSGDIGGSVSSKRPTFKEPKRSNSVKLKKMGGRIKDFCLRRNTDSNVEYQQYRDQTDFSLKKKKNDKENDKRNDKPLSDEKVLKKPPSSSANRESTLDKTLCVAINIFAFFFD